MGDRVRGPNRRALLGGGAAGVAGIGLGMATADHVASPSDTSAATAVEPFYGRHQAGIATSPQSQIAYVALDLRPELVREDIVGLLRIWTEDAARMTSGKPGLADTEPQLAQRPARLTITVGFGPGFFDLPGLGHQRPPWLRPLPAFPMDRLDPAFCGGDVLLQVCADETTTVSHAVRALCRSVTSLVSVRWVQRGFRDATADSTPRNLMGQLDGTTNIAAGTADFDQLIWDNGAQQSWLAGGTSLVLRRIEMNLDTWDEIDPPARESTIGRTLSDGAPLTGGTEFTEPDFAAVDAYGIPVIPPSSHIARAHHRNDNERFLRRAYNYDDAPAPGKTSNSGLLFGAYQRDPNRQFLPVQQRLAEFDALNVWTAPVGSAVFAIPPGVPEPGGYIGQSLLRG